MAYTEVLFLIASICALVYCWCKWNYSYWTRNGIPQADPTPLIGNMKPFLTLKTSFSMHLSNLYNDKRFVNDAVIGIYALHKPALVIRDLELVKSVLIKDFNKFSNRVASADPHRDPLGSNNLFIVKNPYWKELRAKLSPAFTSGKIKTMYPLMLDIANELEVHLSTYKRDAKSSFIEETKEICALFTTDMISTIAFGIRANSLQNPNAEFRKICRMMFDFDIRRAKDFFIAFFLPKLVSTFRVKLFPEAINEFSRSTFNHVMDERVRSGNQRNDLIDILIDLRKSGNFESYEKMANIKGNDFFVAQGLGFLSAGFETSSSTMSFALFELSWRPDIQTRLREEICEAFLENNGTIPYEKISSLEYLGMVVDETLRLYPILPFLDRTCEAPYSLEPYYNYKVPNEMPIYIPVAGIQRDPQYWSDPDTFDPERFSVDNKKSHYPMSYIPFGSGPHNCVGMRIGLLQTKLGLVHFLKNHSVSPCEKTPKKILYDPKSFTLHNIGGINLKITNDELYNQRRQA